MVWNDPIPELKRQLTAALLDVLKTWRPTDLRFWTTLDQPGLSHLRHGNLKRFSAVWLIRILSDLGYDVNITVTKTKERRGRILKRQSMGRRRERCGPEASGNER